MSISTHRGSRRVFRRTQSKRFLVTLPKTRKGLLLGSSLCGGSLMLLGATLFMPNAAMAACGISSPGVIDCSGTFTGQYTTPGLTGDQQVNIDTGTDWESTGGTGTLGLLNIDNSTGASDSIYGSFKSDNGPPNSTTKIETNGSGRVNQSAIAVQFVSGSDGVIHINNIDPAVSITGYNDALRLRTGSVSTDSITLGGEGGIEVHTQGTLKSTIRGEGIDAKAGNGGIGIFVDGGSVSSEGSQGIVAQTGAHWDSESGWSGGNIDIAVAYNATVTGDAGGPTTITAARPPKAFTPSSVTVNQTGTSPSPTRATLPV